MSYYVYAFSFEIRLILDTIFCVATNPYKRECPVKNSSKLERSYKLSKISILRNTLNFEVRQILYATFLVAINPYNKKCSATNSPKLKNNEVIN